MFLWAPMQDPVYQFSTILAIATKWQASTKYRINNGHENFARHSILNRLFALLLSPSIRSDKPCKSVRNGQFLPWQDKIDNKVVTKGYTKVLWVTYKWNWIFAVQNCRPGTCYQVSKMGITKKS
jgi:hypothetical protein